MYPRVPPFALKGRTMAKARLADRIRLAARAVTGLFDDKSLDKAYGLLSGLYPANVGAIPQRGTKEILEAYGTMPWLRAVSQKIANAVAATEWVLYAPANGKRNSRAQRLFGEDREKFIAKAIDQGQIRTITEHIFLEGLTKGNNYLVGPSLFRTTQVHVDLVGEAFWVKERNALGAPVAFWPIPPHWVISTPTPSSRFYTVQFAAWHGQIPDTEVLWFCDPDPSNPYGRGTGLARALTDELETDEYAARHSRMTFINRARPDLIIWPEETKNDAGVISSENAERLAERWRSQHQGFWRAALPYFATRKLGVKEVGQSFQDLSLVDLREFERDTIRQVFGVPPEMMGIVTPGTARATIETGEYIFEKHVIAPRREFLRAYLQERIIPEYDERLILGFNSTIGEDRTFILDAAKAAPWTRSFNEWRKMQYLDPLPGDKGETYMMPLSSTPVKDPSVAPPTPASVLASPSGVENPARRGIDLTGVAGRQKEWAESVVACKEAGDEHVEHLLHSIDDVVDDLPGVSLRAARLEPKVRRLIAEQFASLQNMVPMPALAAAMARRDVDMAMAQIPLDGWALSIEDNTNTWVRDAFLAGATLAADEADIRLVERAELPLNVVNQAAVEWAKIYTLDLIRQILDATREAIRAAIIQALEEGWGADEMARYIRSVVGLTTQQAAAVARFGQRLAQQHPELSIAQLQARIDRYAEAQRRARALTIARTELIRAGNAGQQALWDKAIQAGLLLPERMRKTWVVTLDERLEAICEALGEEDPVPIDQPFSNGMMHPPAHPNCRCTMGLVMAKDVRSHIPEHDDWKKQVAVGVKSGMSGMRQAVNDLTDRA